MTPLTWWIAVALFPSLLTALGLGLCWLENRVPAQALPEPAGPWIERWIARQGRQVLVEVVPADSPDAYWPEAATIGISEVTYGGTRPKDWAVVAHELGHAETLSLHPLLPWLLPGARLMATLGWRFAIAGLLTALLFDEAAAAWFALIMLVVSVGASLVVCADEIAASIHGMAIISSDPRVGTEGRRRAGAAMAAAATAYLLGALGQLVVLALWAPLVEAVIGDPGRLLAPTHLGMWLVLAGTPVVAVRVALALRQFIAPEPIPSELDLWALLSREARWESSAALGVLAMVVGMHAAVQGPLPAVASALALAVALGPVYGLFLALLSLPVVVARRIWGSRPVTVRYLRPARDDVPQAMLSMWADPPWYLRAVWLLPLAYLPIVLVLAARVIGEGS